MWKKWITLRSDAEPRAELQQVCLLTHSTLSWRLLHRSVRPGSQNGDIAAATWTQHTHKQTRQAAKKPSHSRRLPASSHMTSGVSTLQRSDLERELSINRKRFREGFDHVIITSAKDVMFSPTSVCWSVGLSDGWHKNYRMIPPHWWFRVPGPGFRVPAWDWVVFCHFWSFFRQRLIRPDDRYQVSQVTCIYEWIRGLLSHGGVIHSTESVLILCILPECPTVAQVNSFVG